MNNKTLVTLLFVPALAVLVIALVVGAFRQALEKPYWDVAVYEDMSFSGARGQWYDQIATGPGTEVSGIASLYVHLDDGTVLYLPELDEETLEPLVRESGHVDDNEGGFSYYKATWGTFYFRSGAIDNAYIEPPARISRDPDGPACALPISHDDMIAEFGEPLEYERAYSSAP